MTIAGIILALLGAVSCVYGITQNNSFESQLGSLLSSGSTNPGTTFIVIGAVAAVIGIVLLIIGLSKKKQ